MAWRRSRWPNGNVRLIRNHENRNASDTAKVKGDPATAYDRKGGGGTTSLEVRIGDDGTAELVRDFVSLNGTIVNCAGGPTPWGSWLTCEETVAGKVDGWEQEHGYIFEVPVAATGAVTPVPLKAMGRFVHEAIAVDRDTGIVYETEDHPPTAGFYRFIPTTRGRLSDGGRLQMLAIHERPNYDTGTGQKVGDELSVRWVEIAEPDSWHGRQQPDRASSTRVTPWVARGSRGWRDAGTEMRASTSTRRTVATPRWGRSGVTAQPPKIVGL